MKRIVLSLLLLVSSVVFAQEKALEINDTGSVKINKDLTTEGAIQANSTLDVKGVVTADTTVRLKGAVIADSTLTVTGTVESKGTVKAVTVEAATVNSGNINLSGTLSNTVTGTTYDPLPPGTILMYNGANWINNSTIPGWFKCDGANGTPDLRSKFIMGSTDMTTVGQTGGNNSYTLTTAQLPAHTHTIDHDHPALTPIDFNHTHTYKDHVASADIDSKDFRIASRRPTQTDINSQAYSTSVYQVLQKSFRETFLATSGFSVTPNFSNSGVGSLGGNMSNVAYTIKKPVMYGYEYVKSPTAYLPNSGTTFEGLYKTQTTNGASKGLTYTPDVPMYRAASGSVGSGAVIENRPSFYSVIFIMKVQ